MVNNAYNNRQDVVANLFQVFSFEISGVFLAWLVNMVGPGPCVIVGGVIACAGLVISAFGINVPMIIICTGALTGSIT